MLVNISDVCFAYKKHQNVISNFNLNIEPLTIHAILGHNGAGKTTLFKLIMGILRHEIGSITINKSYISRKKEISYVPESQGLYMDLSVKENLEFRYRLSDQSNNGMAERIDYLLDIFGISDKKNEQVKFLSQGLTKRAALSCAIVGRPKLLIMDEPTNGVDPASLEILSLVLQQLKNNETSIILSSHDLGFVRQVATEITIINNGQNVYNGLNTNLDEATLKKIYFSNTKEDKLLNYEQL